MADEHGANDLVTHAVLRYVERNGAAYFTELWREIETRKRPLQKALDALTATHAIVAIIEPGVYPNRVRYELPGRPVPLTPLPRERYWEGTFGPPTRDAELNMESDLGLARHHRQARALRVLTRESMHLSALGREGVVLATIDDLADIGLVLGGVDLAKHERTFRLSALGAILQGRLKRNSRNRSPAA